MRAGYINNDNYEYNIHVREKDIKISDDSFLKITTANKSIYLATHHNAACYFSILERDAGSIKGDEEWVHIDKREHPDNAFLEEGVTVSPATSLKVLSMYLDEKNPVCRVGIGAANFMTAQAKIFPEMRFIHLHNGSVLDASPIDWGGMKFVRACPVEKCDRVLMRHLPRISSLDLDVFGYYSDFRDRKTDMMRDKIVEIAGASNILMIFTSPGYMRISDAEQWMEEIVRNLIDDKC